MQSDVCSLIAIIFVRSVNGTIEQSAIKFCEWSGKGCMILGRFGINAIKTATKKSRTKLTLDRTKSAPRHTKLSNRAQVAQG